MPVMSNRCCAISIFNPFWRACVFVATALFCYCAAADTSTLPQAMIVITIADNTPPPQQRGYHARQYRLSPITTQLIAALERDYAMRRVDGWPLRLLDKYCAVMAVDSDIDTGALLQRLRQDARISLAQPLQTFEIRGIENQAARYNDPYFSQQYGKLTNLVAQLHQRATGRHVRVAIIDTGADQHHPDLQHLLPAHNFVEADTTIDGELHGTAVAGIIAASANNGIGIVGLAPGAEVSVLKACWQLNAGDIAARCNTLTLAKALSFAIENGDDIINLSLGGPDDPLLTQLVQVAIARGILIIAAREARDRFPATIPGVVAVGAADNNNEWLARVTPAANMIVAGANELLSTSPGGHYDFFSGSSMAAARVTGLAALMKQEQQKLTAEQLLENMNRWLSDASTIASTR